MNNDFNNEELNFHYKRENRLKNAPNIVKEHYEEDGKPSSGFFKSLVATKSSRFLLGSIVILLVMIFFVKNVDKIAQPTNIDGIPIELSAFLFESTIYVTATAKEFPIEKDIPITICFNALNKENKIVKTTTIYSIFDGTENLLRTTFENNNIMTIECHISTETKTITIKTNVQK